MFMGLIVKLTSYSNRLTSGITETAYLSVSLADCATITAQPPKKEGDNWACVSSKVPKLVYLLFEVCEDFVHSTEMV